MHTALVVSPHADDAAAFCGATLAKFAAGGWRVILARVTDDAKDSMDLTLEETTRINTEELHRAAKIMGIAEIVELGFPTDCLADVPLTKIRERIVYLFRKYKPYAVFTFDPYAPNEPNQDHLRVAQAVEEAFWVSCFHLHYPEHAAEGLEPFSVCERWYFARTLPSANHVEDVTEFIDKKIEALCAHRTMMRNTIHQSLLQLRTWGRRVPVLDAVIDGDLSPLMGQVIMGQATAAAHEMKLGADRMAEVFRLTRFDDLEEFFQTMSEPVPGAEPPAKRKILDIYE